MNTCQSPCTPMFSVADHIKWWTLPSLNKTELALEMHRSTLVAIRYTDADFILDCNVIVGFSNRLSV